MKNLDGYNIPFDFDGFVQMSDLIYYDGPLLALLRLKQENTEQ